MHPDLRIARAPWLQMGAEATNLSKYRYHEVFMASGDDIDGPSPWKCGGSI